MNVAVACARLGVPAAFVGRVSTDAYGEAIWAFLRDNRVDVRACQRGPEPTARAVVEHTPRLRFRFEGKGTADTMLSSVEMSRLGKGPHILHGGTLGMFRGETAATLARLAERHPGVVSLDPNVRPPISMIAAVGTTITADGWLPPTYTGRPRRTWHGYGPVGVERSVLRNCCRAGHRWFSSPVEDRAPRSTRRRGNCQRTACP